MKKKLLKILTVLIIALIVLFVLLINYKRKLEVNNQNKQNNDGLLDKKIEITNLDAIFRYYEELPASKEVLEKSISRLINELLLTKRDFYGSSSTNDIIEYYYQNESNIKEIGIATLDDFLILSQNIKGIYGNKDTNILNMRIELNEQDITNKDYFIFEIIVNNSNATTFSLKGYINLPKTIKKDSKQTTQIYYKSNSELSQILENYKGVVSVTDFITTLENLTNNIQGIRNVTKRTNLNDQLQYYEQNKEKLQKMGIQSGEDFQSIVAQISNVDWSQGTQLDYYSIDLNTFSLKEDYAEFVLRYNYNTLDQINVKASLAQNGNVKPSIKFSGMDGERE